MGCLQALRNSREEQTLGCALKAGERLGGGRLHRQRTQHREVSVREARHSQRVRWPQCRRGIAVRVSGLCPRQVELQGGRGVGLAYCDGPAVRCAPGWPSARLSACVSRLSTQQALRWTVPIPHEGTETQKHWLPKGAWGQTAGLGEHVTLRPRSHGSALISCITSQR